MVLNVKFPAGVNLLCTTLMSSLSPWKQMTITENEINETDQLINNQNSVIPDKITYPVKMKLKI